MRDGSAVDAVADNRLDDIAQAREALIGELLPALPDPLVGCDRSGTVVYWSDAARNLYGHLASDAEGTRVLKLLAALPMPLLEIMEGAQRPRPLARRDPHRTREGTDWPSRVAGPPA